MEYIILISIGCIMGFFGGLLGIGGSVIMIPAMLLFFKGDQHLYQAAAMICNFFVAASAIIVHHRAKVLVLSALKWLIPAGILGILVGVWASNFEFFAGDKSLNLTRLFGLFIIYVAIINLLKFRSHDGGKDGFDLSRTKKSPTLTLLSGLITGLSGGMLGIGGGSICTPLQQLSLKMPLKRAMANSSALIASTALIGAFYKTITLPKHGIEPIESIKIAIVIIPTAVLGAYIGGHLMHKLNKNIVRALFIALLTVAAIKLLTI